ncbi:MAG: Nif11-like leader peptide family natural product precursor [Bacteroidota bacterium]
MKEPDNIDDHLLGLLSEADERAFLERVAQDQALAQQLAQRQKLIRGIQHKGRRALKAELETFHQQHQPQAAAPPPAASCSGWPPPLPPCCCCSGSGKASRPTPHKGSTPNTTKPTIFPPPSARAIPN